MGGYTVAALGAYCAVVNLRQPSQLTIGIIEMKGLSPEKWGVLLANLGTPNAPTTSAVRRYLHEFLSDRRVIEMPRMAWWPILYGWVLPFRPYASAAAYRKVWREEGSPLLVYAQAQRDAVRLALAARLPEPVPVALGMRYGQPSIARSLDSLLDSGCGRIAVLPMYPQYSATTTGSTFDAVAACLRRRRTVPSLHFVSHYYHRQNYIDSLAASVRDYRARHGTGEQLLMSFHGLPQRYVDAGDPYAAQCRATGAKLAAALGLANGEWQVTFQSRLGKAPWLQPYTDETVRQLGRAGVKRIDVVCPGFSADCLETLEEVALRNEGYFREAGGQELNYIPALNTRVDHIECLTDVLVEAMSPSCA